MEGNIILSRIFCDFIILFLCGLSLLFIHLFAQPFQRGFYCDDESIRYPYKPDTVTVPAIAVIGIFIPALLIILTEIFRYLAWEKKCEQYFKSYKFKDRNVNRFIVRLYTFLGFFALGLIFNQLMNSIAKYTIGRQRPHFLEVCKPDIGYQTCPGNHQYITNFTCTGTNAHLNKDSQLSFYSGHTAFSFYGAWYTSLYLQARLYKPIGSRLLIPAVQFALICGASFVAYSRISDYKHHWSDVLVGAIIGSSIGVVVAVCMARVFKLREIPSCEYHHSLDRNIPNNVEMEAGFIPCKDSDAERNIHRQTQFSTYGTRSETQRELNRVQDAHFI
uniref:AcidPPc domain-containing protein n=1 Tax=Parastrongyloides trichosuri TaxID=131310 RepID=A0A0N4ZP60_PARTI